MYIKALRRLFEWMDVPDERARHGEAALAYKNVTTGPLERGDELSGRDWTMFRRLILAMISRLTGIIAIQRPKYGLMRRKSLSNFASGAV